MTNDQREIRRKLRILQHADQSDSVSKTFRYFGVGHRWRHAYRTQGESGLANKRSVPHNHPNKAPTPSQSVPMRIVWYLERYHGIRISDAGVYCIFCRYGLNWLPKGTAAERLLQIAGCTFQTR